MKAQHSIELQQLRPELQLSAFFITLKERKQAAEHIIDLVSLLMKRAEILQVQEFKQSPNKEFFQM